MAAEEASARLPGLPQTALGQTEGRLCVAWPVRCAACAKLRVLREHLVLPLGDAHLLQLVEGRAAARLLRGQGGEAAPPCRSVCCTPVQHSAAWWAASWICARSSRGCSGAVLQAAASGARHARRRAWPGQRQRARSMGQPARRERCASWHIGRMLPLILWSTAVNLAVVDQNRRAFHAVYVHGFSSAFSFARFAARPGNR